MYYYTSSLMVHESHKFRHLLNKNKKCFRDAKLNEALLYRIVISTLCLQLINIVKVFFKYFHKLLFNRESVRHLSF